ncbi:hypothetical protein COV42_01390 [Candidatus Campbellbacteria bacterium CG11_big_fil_rev_8_21_14_0_20_44_21]|uniref:DoxX family protein n=1 Tax=Candidatus Campbellbacteria bacterium CG22_combo_CG10-13_8_21_14_all_43_18 TaxID=1974530 RepID=A0A2H0DVQ9_9BACT|nr:MAG: hypothetical protein COW82_03030 [Candidatus Campbellbacteria bacterium CG22_combo_CG10-13_8_21_14_all_43_18]PIR24313.1 MAG: hypothetical protein COV42_01390 [Candidatus Campbellbacteria bacterium CG11_big_fil_rev_8_21_14_0_20_44_21]
MKTTTQYFIGLLRLLMGFIFLWAFLDKTFGLGFATSFENAWLNGGSPTTGFLTHATKGPFAEIFQSLAGNGLIDVLFMLGLLFVGVTLVFGIMVRLGSLAGVVMLALMYLASAILPENNPLIDDHIIYAIIMLLFISSDAGSYLGLGKRWDNSSFVKISAWFK